VYKAIKMASPFKDPRTGIYYFRRVVPEKLRPHLNGRREVKVTLETRDPAEAKQRYPKHADECERLFEAARRKIEAGTVFSAQSMVDEYIRDGRDDYLAHFPDILESRYVYNLHLLGEGKLELIDRDLCAHWNWDTPPAAEHVAAELKRLQALIEAGSRLPLSEILAELQEAKNYRPIAFFINKIAKRFSVAAKPSSEAYSAIGHALYNGIDLLAAGADRQYTALETMLGSQRASVISGLPRASATLSAPESHQSAPVIQVAREAEHPLSSVFEEWAAAQLKGKKVAADKTVDEWRRNIGQFISVHGDVDVRDITARMVREFRKIAQRLPVKPKKHIASLPIRDQIQIAADEDLPTWQPATVNKALSAIRVTLEFAKEVSELIETNPAASVKSLAKGDYEDSRIAFDDDDLNAIFRNPRIEDSTGISSLTLLWLLILGPYTGCRLGELARLRPINVRQDQGIWFIAIERDRKAKRERDSDAKKSVKTAMSIRDIPVHSFLERAGFLDYVAKQEGQDWLFPDLSTDRYGSRATRLSRLFNDYFSGVGITDSEKVYHSFRHLIRRRMRGRGSEKLADLIAGHAGSSVGRKYGRGADLPILKEFVERIQYSTVNWEPALSLLKALEG